MANKVRRTKVNQGDKKIHGRWERGTLGRIRKG